MDVLLIALAAGLVSLVFTRAIRSLATVVGLVDHPDGHRKLQSQPIALGGGLAVFASSVLVLALAAWWRQDIFEAFVKHGNELWGLLFAGATIVVLGLFDDRVGLRGRQKLIGQLLAASILVAFGITFERVSVFGWTVEFGLLSVPFTIFWLLGAINSVNLLDGVDGLATMVGIIITTSIALMAGLAGQTAVVLVAAAFASALLGFLRFNFPPATVYLGDAGSMLIGLVIGTLAFSASLKGPGTVFIIAPLSLCAIPIFDSATAILRRKLTGRSIYATDRGHLHHRLMQQMPTGRVLALIGLACLATSVAALASIFFRNDAIAMVSSLALVAIFVVTRTFGHAELSLLANRLRSVGRSLVAVKRPLKRSWESTVHIQGNRPWDLLWTTLTESAEKLNLCQIKLELHLPALEEGYSAAWSCDRKADSPAWRLDLPLMLEGRPVGALLLGGECDDGATIRNIEPLIDLLAPFEERLRMMISNDEVPEPLSSVPERDFEASIPVDPTSKPVLETNT
ncbi:WecA-like glycosyltransferase [Symmachiella macrocystis]|uniref:WecA-like glycosyltransferase n=1 Tax=Symmachiella macrocystis TaxID=2527985 RepID=A0A5C6B6Q3_9PLAN|nr:MraY family glycosyltransferase [Symmachiella macrocystis]TWU06956.1 WecA-like glycosyltransferase [Symmachiella macrocystis]